MYMLTNSFCPFLSFRALVLVGFIPLHLEAVFSSARFFFLTANVPHRTLGLAVCLVGMHSAAASKWALMKFLYSSFGVYFCFLLKCIEFVSQCYRIFISNIPVIKQGPVIGYSGCCSSRIPS